MDTIYTEVTGTTCRVNGERGTVTGFMLEVGKKVGAFVKLDERSAMLYVELGAQVAACSCGRPDLGLDGHHVQCNVTTGRSVHHEVTAAREIDRDEFDRITGLDEARREWGWAA